MSRERTAKVVMARTPLGTIVAARTKDPDRPGIWIDLRLPKSGVEIPLGLVEYSADSADLPDSEGHIITCVWGDATLEDYTERVVHKGIAPLHAGIPAHDELKRTT